jgi:DNA-directed RNA polymerase specialized sigma24 family protein
MTRAEFDGWIEQHYGELLAVAKRRDRIEPEDVLQAAVTRVVATESFTRTDAPWPWMVEAIRSAAKDARRSGERRQSLGREFKKVSRAGLSHGWKRPAPRAE